MPEEDKNYRFINIGGGNYNECIQGNYIQGDYYNVEKPQNLAEAAAEIQKLLEQLEKSYPTNTTVGKMAIATEAISQIDKNPNLATRILSAIKADGVSAFEQFLNHPASSFIIGALEDWQKESISLTASMIATLVITKAFEKTGEILGEKALEQGGKLLSLLKRKEPNRASAIELAQTQPLDYGQASLVEQIEEAAKKDPEIAQAVEALADTVKSQPSVIQNFTNTVDKNYGGNVGNVSIENQNQTFNF